MLLYKRSKSLDILNKSKCELLDNVCYVKEDDCGFECIIELIDSDKGEFGLFIKCDKCNLNLNINLN